ncbi:hypothetical protein PPL_01473 [Heterostelium album PN500]|uniref:Uncharacterized protein n=1 Tax=Heterostelium pallidum (strain ATCC 26659 / Pp 5 / PN500) TaxID=670386 RepID=D3AZD3_HETP5|nr:hypothetical protein PPL_01473 [Heterostelium album PN500]EFA85516.1 hypothetical protein PPL_01473 [Heterostelium album PN500]|eukprot:XP_020437624.1 hypothetical protein PPL_01473 [Heterostelium album PN500]
MSTEKKTVEDQEGTFKHKNIQLSNESNEALVALIKMDPNAHYYQELSLGFNGSPLGGGINGGAKKAIKNTGPIQRVNLRVEKKIHEIDIDGKQAYVSVYKLDASGDFYLGVIEERLIKKKKILTITQEHVNDLTRAGFKPSKFDLLFNKISITPSSPSTSTSTPPTPSSPTSTTTTPSTPSSPTTTNTP